jgi:hypothetical protein
LNVEHQRSAKTRNPETRRCKRRHGLAKNLGAVWTGAAGTDRSSWQTQTRTSYGPCQPTLGKLELRDDMTAITKGGPVRFRFYSAFRSLGKSTHFLLSSCTIPPMRRICTKMHARCNTKYVLGNVNSTSLPLSYARRRHMTRECRAAIEGEAQRNGHAFDQRVMAGQRCTRVQSQPRDRSHSSGLGHCVTHPR